MDTKARTPTASEQEGQTLTKDEALRDELEVHLASLKREGLIEAWHDRRLVAGAELDPSIRTELERADVILFLVSPDFLASPYCNDVEVARAMERHDAGGARVIPVILRPCDWQHSRFARLLAAPKDGQPVTRWPDRDEAFLDVARAIRSAVSAMGRTVTPNEVSVSGRPSASVTTVAALAFPRSSNLRVAKHFSERDRADFLDEAFEFIERFFQASATELERRNPDIETRFRRIDADRFKTTIYRNGKEASACTIFRGTMGGGRGEIYYSQGADGGTNSWNESVHVEAHNQSLYLVAMGMAFHAHNHVERKLAPEGAAEMFWAILIQPLQ